MKMQLYWERDFSTDAFLQILGDFKENLLYSSGRLFLTLQTKYYIYILSSRHHNNINQVNIVDFIVNFENIFCLLRELSKPPCRMTSQNLGNIQRKCMQWSLAIVKPLSFRFTVSLFLILRLMTFWTFFMILWNFICDFGLFWIKL